MLKIAAGMVIAASAAFLMYASMTAELTYFYGADEVLAGVVPQLGERMRLGGYVEPCSILQKTGTLEYRFEVRPDPPRATHHALKHPEMRGKTISVRYTGVPPDTFKDEAEVIVTGRLQPDGSFVGSDLVAKCPSKYESAEKASGVVRGRAYECSKPVVGDAPGELPPPAPSRRPS